MKKRILASTGLLALIATVGSSTEAQTNLFAGSASNTPEQTNAPPYYSETAMSEFMNKIKTSACPDGPGCERHRYLLDIISSNKTVIEALRRQVEQDRPSSQVRTNSEEIAKLMRSNVELEAEYRRLHPPAGALEWLATVLRNLKPTPAWPASDKKRTLLGQWAALVRSAVDTNQIEVACRRMTKTPEAVSALRTATIAVERHLEEFAAILTNEDLTTYVTLVGNIKLVYRAKLVTPTNQYSMLFWTENGPVQHARIKTPDGKLALVSADFFENGKLRSFRENSLAGDGELRSKLELIFNDDGTPCSYWIDGRSYWVGLGEK